MKSGKSQDTVKRNIKTLVREYEDRGTISKTKPVNKKKAIKQAIAISLKKAGRSRTQQRSKH